MANKSNYKFYMCYTHTIDGKVGEAKIISADTDIVARVKAGGEFDRCENARIGILVKTEGRSETIVSSFERKVI